MPLIRFNKSAKPKKQSSKADKMAIARSRPSSTTVRDSSGRIISQKFSGAGSNELQRRYDSTRSRQSSSSSSSSSTKASRRIESNANMASIAGNAVFVAAPNIVSGSPKSFVTSPQDVINVIGANNTNYSDAIISSSLMEQARIDVANSPKVMKPAWIPWYEKTANFFTGTAGPEQQVNAYMDFEPATAKQGLRTVVGATTIDDYGQVSQGETSQEIFDNRNVFDKAVDDFGENFDMSGVAKWGIAAVAGVVGIMILTK